MTKHNGQCQTKYFGPSYPRHHGVQCEMDDSHSGLRHVAIVDGGIMIRWWTADEKSVLKARLS